MAGDISIKLLGQLEVAVDGVTVSIGTRKERQLLLVLLLEPGRRVSTDRLVEHLWGDSPPSKPMVSLRSYLSNLRRTLGHNPDGDDYIVTEPGGYRLAIKSEAIDTVLFDNLVTQGRDKIGDGDLAPAAGLLDSALGLVRGEPLADMAYEDFAQREINRLTETVIAAEELRATVAVDSGDSASWLPRISGLVEANPLREGIRALHMTALYATGRQVEALRSFQDHRELMTEELGIEPAPELQVLEARILAQDLARPTSKPIEKQREVRVPAARVPVAGRENEIGLLHSVAANSPGVALLVGEAGSGKSTILDSFEADLLDEGWTVARGLCHDDDGMPPLWPWRQVLRDLNLAESISMTAEDEFDRFEMFDEIAARLLDATDLAPVLVVIEDLHWADDDSMQLIRRLGRQARDEQLMIVGASRTTPGALTPVAATWVDVGALAPSAIAEIVRAVTGKQCDVDLAKGLLERTGGNAYYISELAKLAAQEQRQVRADDQVPIHVRQLVKRRLDKLAPATVALLEVGALEPHNFSLELLGEVVGTPVPDVAEQIAAAVEAGVLVADAGAFGRYRFDHAITRESVAAAADPSETTRRHAAIGAVLEAWSDPKSRQHATALSRHFSRGSPAGTARQAIRWASVAARYAASTWSHRDALVHLRRALAAFDHLDDADETARAEILVDVGVYGRITGDVDEAKDALLEAFRVAEEVSNPTLVARAALGLTAGLGSGTFRWYWKPESVALAALYRALEIVPADHILRPKLLGQIGADSYAVTSDDERSSAVTEAVSVAEDLGDPAVLCDALLGQRVVSAWRWDDKTRSDHNDRIRTLARNNKLSDPELRVHQYLVADGLNSGNFDDARRWLKSLVDTARLTGSVSWRFYAAQWEMMLAQIGGDWDGVRSLAERALDPVHGFGEPFAEVLNGQGSLGLVMYGDNSRLESLLRAIAPRSHTQIFASLLFSIVASEGRVAEARDLAESMDLAMPCPDPVGGRLTTALNIEGLVMIGDTDRLEPLIDFLAPAADRLAFAIAGLGGLSFHGPCHYYMARGLTGLGRFEEAAHHIEAGRLQMPRHEAPPYAVQLDLAEALLVLGRDGASEAKPLLTSVRTDALSLAMTTLAAQAGRALDS